MGQSVDRAVLNKALNIARDLGAADAEVIVTHSADLDIEVAQGVLETLETAGSSGLGVRVFTPDRRMGFAYTTALDAGARSVAEAAWQNAIASDPDEHNVLPEEAATSEEDWSEQDFLGIPLADKVAFCRELEQKTLAADTRIARVQEASYSDSRSKYAIANSHGLRRSYTNARCSCAVVAAASEPDTDSEMGWEFDFGPTFSALRPEWVAARCARHATQALGGKPCPTAAMPIVLENRIAASFLSVIVPALMANNVLKGKSLFAGRVGERIASECVTIIDQNDCAPGLNRAPFDGEGASAQRTVLVERGALRGYLHSAYTAHRMGEGATANGGRGGFRSTPEVGATNCFVKPGGAAPEALIEMTGSGLFVTHAMGVHTADPISGDFSLGASGMLIEGGRLTRPVRGVTLAGNMKDLLKNIQAVGNDLRFFGAFGAPSVLVSELMISGA